MKTAKIFMNGRSQAIRLPQEYRVEGNEVYVNKIGDMIIITPMSKEKQWDDFFDGINSFTADFMEQ